MKTRPSRSGIRSKDTNPFVASKAAPKTSSPGISIGETFVPLSNLDKIYYPSVSFTKAQVIDYYIRIATVLLPHLKDRPLTLKRYPNGVEETFFYEKRCPSHRPIWLKTALVRNEEKDTEIGFCVAADLPSLVWIANTGSLELHTSLSLGQHPDRPTSVVFDLDPGENTGILECAQVALHIRELLAWLELECLVKTSGSKGLQLYIPMNSDVTYDETKPFAKAVAQLLEQEHPDLIVSKMKKSLRVNRVLIDWSQNDSHKTTVSVYSLRARSAPTVSAPVSWDEIERALSQADASLLTFKSSDVLARIEQFGDLFKPLLTLEQNLPTDLVRHLQSIHGDD